MKINGEQYRTIWVKKGDPSVIQIIDQRREFLPHEFKIVELKTVEDVCFAIKEMQVRGAGLIGATAGYGMYIAARTAPQESLEIFNAFLYTAGETLKKTRPTAVNLSWAVDQQWEKLQDVKTIEEKIQRAFTTAQEIADNDADMCKSIGKHGVEIIRKIYERKKDTVNILTHCNAGWLAFVDYGSATAPIYEAAACGIPVHVFVDVTGPWNQGARLTAWELFHQNIPHTIISDNAGGHVMQLGLVDMVITGADRVARNGDVANKIGTYEKALAAFDNHIPFYTALPSSTFDWSIQTGKEIPIEERNPEEVKYAYGLNENKKVGKVLIANTESPALNYSFDVTPARLITGLITERRICNADEQDILELFPEKK